MCIQNYSLSHRYTLTSKVRSSGRVSLIVAQSMAKLLEPAVAVAAQIAGMTGDMIVVDVVVVIVVVVKGSPVAKNLDEFCLRYCGEYELNEPNSGESSVSSVSSPPPKS